MQIVVSLWAANKASIGNVALRMIRVCGFGRNLACAIAIKEAGVEG
jgi:hypothetical protein